ncbi:unnamed protein product [Rodentolepis nana]|uniref:Pleckstrin homology domain-containing family A member 8 n=1 Tax=Rodentolepis nana TaxID=102285 RepID=A0A0R3TPD3_RODNA|nr:unnamed protein product [Rodentolepis nana]
MDGSLYKWTNYINGWQQRYFTLRDGILSYYTSESEVNAGCRGAFKVSVCDFSIHPTDSCRFDILIPGEQKVFLKAANSTERQKWIIALGTCKAGITNVDDLEKMRTFLIHRIQEQTEQSIEVKRSELRINRDLLVQQINGVCCALKATAGENREMIEAVNSLKATCDTLLSNTDELIRLLFNSGRFKAALAASNPDGSPANSRKPSALPQSLQNYKPTSRKNSTNTSEISPRTTRLIEQIATTVATNKNGNKSLLNNHLRALRLSRPYPTFFSKMEFSFEDLALSQSAANKSSISAVEFLACCRSALTFFPSLASVSANPTAPQNNPDLSQLGSLQTVYAEVLTNVVRLELAVKTLASEGESSEPETTRQRSLALSLADIVDVEMRAKQYQKPGSAYLALLWLARCLNFAAEFLDLLFKDTATAFRQNSPNETIVEDIATKAYTKTLRDFHNWSVRGTATVILKAVPKAEKIQAVLLCVPTSDISSSSPPIEAMAQLQLDVERFVEALRRCLACIQGLLVQRNLDHVFPPVSSKE